MLKSFHGTARLPIPRHCLFGWCQEWLEFASCLAWIQVVLMWRRANEASWLSARREPQNIVKFDAIFSRVYDKQVFLESFQVVSFLRQLRQIPDRFFKTCFICASATPFSIFWSHSLLLLAPRLVLDCCNCDFSSFRGCWMSEHKVCARLIFIQISQHWKLQFLFPSKSVCRFA